jgi:molybdopterin synthase catalytic subunit
VEVDVIEITDQELDPEAISASVKKNSNGAVVTFFGTTRDSTQDRKVQYLEYEAYQPMAEKKLGEISDDIRRKYRIEDIALVHRVKHLGVGEISLVVAVGSPHREAAFAACQYAVDRIKHTVPIWKKEYFVGGDVWVESPEDVALREAAELPSSSL